MSEENCFIRFRGQIYVRTLGVLFLSFALMINVLPHEVVYYLLLWILHACMYRVKQQRLIMTVTGVYEFNILTQH